MRVSDEKQAGEHKLRCDRSTVICTCTSFPRSPSCMTSLHHCHCQRIFTLSQAHHFSSFSSQCPCSFWDGGWISLRTHGASETRRLKVWGIGGVWSSNVSQNRGREAKKKHPHTFSISTPLSPPDHLLPRPYTAP